MVFFTKNSNMLLITVNAAGTNPTLDATFTAGLISRTDITLKAGQKVASVTVGGTTLTTNQYSVINNGATLRLTNVDKGTPIEVTMVGETTPYTVIVK